MNGEREQLAITIAVPRALVEAIAERVARLLAEQQPGTAQASSPWLDFEAACVYLGFSRDQLYKLTAARAIPVRKKAGGQGLLFNRHELDQWLERAYPRLDRGR